MKSKHIRILCLPIFVLLSLTMFTGCLLPNSSSGTWYIGERKVFPTMPPTLETQVPGVFISEAPDHAITAYYQFYGNQYHIEITGRAHRISFGYEQQIRIEIFVYTLHNPMHTTNPFQIANPTTHPENAFYIRFDDNQTYRDFYRTIPVGTLEPHSMRIVIVEPI